MTDITIGDKLEPTFTDSWDYDEVVDKESEKKEADAFTSDKWLVYFTLKRYEDGEVLFTRDRILSNMLESAIAAGDIVKI